MKRRKSLAVNTPATEPSLFIARQEDSLCSTQNEMALSIFVDLSIEKGPALLAAKISCTRRVGLMVPSEFSEYSLPTVYKEVSR